VTLLYFLPLVYIAKITFDQANVFGSRLFADWTFMLLESSDSGAWGIGLSIFVHAQIFMVIFSFQYITFFIKNSIRRLESLRDSSRGQYS